MEEMLKGLRSGDFDFDLQLFAGDNDDSGAGDTDDIDTGDNTGKDQDQDGKDDAGKKTGDKLFTQEDIDRIVRDRLKREKKAWEQKVEEERKKAAMTETERLKAEKDEADKKAQEALKRANDRLIRAEVIAQAAAMKIIDGDAAYTLMSKEGVSVEEDGNVIGVKAALEALVKSKPYLVASGAPDAKRTGDDQSNDKGKRTGFNMNDLIRRASGRSQ